MYHRVFSLAIHRRPLNKAAPHFQISAPMSLDCCLTQLGDKDIQILLYIPVQKKARTVRRRSRERTATEDFIFNRLNVSRSFMPIGIGLPGVQDSLPQYFVSVS